MGACARVFVVILRKVKFLIALKQFFLLINSIPYTVSERKSAASKNVDWFK